MNRLDTEFFQNDTKEVAQNLLGKFLVRETEKGIMIGKITEVEAYLGSIDKASHAYQDRKTERTIIMYMKPGTLYVYLIYGMYHCLNVITEPEGVPCAVLFRKLYPIEGIELMLENRNVQIDKRYKNLADGPGKLCMALNITKKLFNGYDVCKTDSKLYFIQGETVDKKSISISRRIGIDYAEEDRDRLLRFTLKDDTI
ncbi:MAG: DNA-3-methyladenine glycosylase [Promethearchaeota archaeon]